MKSGNHVNTANERVAKTPIVISGAALITPLGLSLESTWNAVRAGRCGLGDLPAIEQPLPPGSTGGQAPALPADFAPHLPREVRYLRRAIADALQNAHIDPGRSYSTARCGFMLGTTLHGMRSGGEFLRSKDPSHLSHFLAGATLREAAAGIGFSGFSATVCSACSSSLGSIALGTTLLRSGQLDLVVAGGYDTISEYVYAGFNSLRLVAPGALRPFTRDRQGMKLAEGYGIVVLERADDALRRGVHPLAKILGYGESADAHHLTQPHPQGEGAARAMQAALVSAGIAPGIIDLVCAHGTGTPDNDAGEYAALSRIFGADLPRVPVVAFKSHLGHTLGGAGAVELILAALSLRDQIAPACVNVRADEIEFAGLNVATGSGKPAPLRATMNTSLGFGGANTVMVLGVMKNEECRMKNGEQKDVQSAECKVQNEEQRTRNAIAPSSLFTLHSSLFTSAASPAPVFITGIGVVLPGMIGNDAFARALTAAEPRRVLRDTGPIPEADIIGLLNARRVRRMSDYVKLSLAATMLACQDAGISDLRGFAANCSALLGTMHGSTNYCEAYYRQIVDEGLALANPMLFAEGVPNAAAAHLSLMLSLKGPCQTIIGTRTAGLDALHLAALRIAGGEWDRAIVGAAEEYSALANSAFRHWGLHGDSDPAIPFSGRAGGFVAGCGAVSFVLESAQSLAQRGATARGKVVASTGPRPIPLHSAGLSRDALRIFDDEKCILTSANGTWLDRLEAAAIGRRDGRIISTLAGYVAETHSVTPLAGIAAVLLTRRMPMLLEGASVRGATDNDSVTRFSIVASDYTRLVSAATFCAEV
jgi:3-oxoacyl-[acyl-carrier-protein] synthase II